MAARSMIAIVIALIGLSAAAASCDGDADADADGDVDGDTDTDVDGDTDTDTDVDGDTDTDVDGDTDTDVDGDIDGDADTDVDGDADTDVDGDVDGDADTDVDGDTDGDTDGDADIQPPGDCTSDDDCPEGSCVELTAGGWRTCAAPVPEATSCSFPEFDECCDSSTCAVGACYPGPIVRFCGGAEPIPANVCASDLCSVAEPCSFSEVCVPAGVYGRPVATCLYALCRTAADCTEEAGGSCEAVPDSCCSIPSLVCVYPSDGCRSDVDCPGGHCTIEGTRTVCRPGPAMCPA